MTDTEYIVTLFKNTFDELYNEPDTQVRYEKERLDYEDKATLLRHQFAVNGSTSRGDHFHSTLYDTYEDALEVYKTTYSFLVALDTSADIELREYDGLGDSEVILREII